MGNGPAPTARGVRAEARLLNSAAKLFRSKPFDEVSVGDLSRAAAVQTSSFYQRFGSKEALAAAVYKSALARRTGILRDALAGVPKRAREELAAAVDGLLHDPDARLLLNLDRIARQHGEMHADAHGLREMAVICAEWCRKTTVMAGSPGGLPMAALLDGATRAAWTASPSTITPDSTDSLVEAIWRGVAPATKARSGRASKASSTDEPDLLSRTSG